MPLTSGFISPISPHAYRKSPLPENNIIEEEPISPQSSKKRKGNKNKKPRLGVTMYVKKDLTLAPLLESQIEEDLPVPTLAGESKGVDKTFYGRIKLTGEADSIAENNRISQHFADGNDGKESVAS